MSQVAYYRESEAQDAMAVVAKWIGKNYGLKVVYHDGTAVDADIFRGIIRIPKLACSGGITEEALMLLRGRVYHEAGHIRFTDLKKDEYPSGIHFQITNAVEDRREERCMAEDFAGAGPIFRAMMIYHNKKIAERAAEGPVGGVIWEALVAMSFQSEGIRPAWRLSEKAQKYYDAAYSKFCEWKTLTSAKGSVALAAEILEILKQVHEEEKEKERQEQEQEEQESQEPEDNESSESSDDSESEESDEGEGSGEGSDGEGEESDGEESGEGDSEESEGDESGEGGSESSEAEEGEEGDDEEGEGSSGSEGDDSESESEEGSDAEGSDGEDSEEDEEGESGGSQGGDFDDEEDESDGSSASSGDGDFDDEDDDEEGESSDSDGSESDDGDESEEGESANESVDGADDGDTEYDGSDKPESDGSEPPEEEEDERTEEEILEEMEEEMEGFTLEELSDEDIAAALESLDPKDKSYLANRDSDEHIPIEGTDWDKTRYKEQLDKISSKVASLTAALVQALRARSRCKKQGFQRRGRIDTTRLVAIAKNLSKEVFYRVQEGQKVDTAISIIIDESSSMSHRTGAVRLVTIAICEALSQLGIPFEVTGTTTKYMAGRCPSLDGLDRTNPIQYRHYKDFGENWAVVRHGICQLSSYNHNIDGETVEYAARRLAARPEARKIVFSLCDGQPVAGHGNNDTMGRNLIRSCERARENDIEVYGIGVGTMEPIRYYGKENFVYVPDAQIDESFAKAFVDIVGGLNA